MTENMEVENASRISKYFIDKKLVKITFRHTDKIYFDVGNIKDVIIYSDGRFSCGGECKKGTIFNGTKLCSHVEAAIYYLIQNS